ncbi:MAG: alpha-galactosidase [Pseudomonadota bacterium]
MSANEQFIILATKRTSVVIECEQGHRPSILYWGPKLDDIDGAILKRMATRQHAPGGPDIDIPSSLMNETGSGLPGPSGFIAHRSGKGWANLFVVRSIERGSDHQVKINCVDRKNHVRAEHIINVHPGSDLMTCQTHVLNDGVDNLSLEWCASAVLPLDQRATKLFGFTGRWANEFQLEEVAPFHGSYVRENKSGRTSHDNFPGLMAAFERTTEQLGACYGFHLGWSGNSRLRVDRLNDGRTFVQLGEYFYPGEIVLSPGERYQTPKLYAAFTNDGLSALSRNFHEHVRGEVMDPRSNEKPRPIHYNTWEAVYFDHDLETLKDLADKASGVGAERFVLDDGWFGTRRNDASGLGDWWPSEDVYPEGLGPLIKHVTDLGMEFGLWFEPEMVNPDSELFRSHPDWILHAEDIEQIPSRSQFALDLTRKDVSDYLFEKMDRILREHRISYIKWDMNRNIHHPGSFGKPAAHRQTYAVYELMKRLRSAHTDVEIESCSSGGGRADYGVLHYTDRIWTSDSNDALDRQRIQRGASHFFPLEVLGAHVGPDTCHITGRRLTMELRVATAMFGHMGMELDLRDLPQKDLETLKTGVALHKAHRSLIHTGDYHRLETPSHVNAVGVVAKDQAEALFSWCNLVGHTETLPGRIFFSGLNADESYRVRIVWPSPVVSRSSPSVIEALDLNGNGSVIAGDALMQMGIQVPLLYPETCLIWHLDARANR